MPKILFIILFLNSNLYSSEYDQFKNTKFYVTYNHNGKPALLLGETYKRQTGKEMKDLVGRTFKFLFDDGTLKDAKIEKLEKVCYIFKNVYMDDVPDEELCSYIATQNELSGYTIGAFHTDLPTLKFEWVFKPNWKQVQKVEDIDMTKVKAHLARNGGQSFEAKVGDSVSDFEQMKKDMVGEPSPVPKSLEEVIYPIVGGGRKFTTQNDEWQTYFNRYGIFILNQGEIFYSELNHTRRHASPLFDGLIRVNGAKFYLLRYGGGLSMYDLKPKEFEDPLYVGHFRPMFAYVGDDKEFKEGLKLALHPCVSKLFGSVCSGKVKASSNLFVTP